MAVNAGQYDQRVTLQQPSAGQDAAGQPTAGFTDVATVWAKVRPTRGKDFLAADGKQSTLDAVFCVRYRTDATAGWRILWNGAYYDIQGEPANVNGANVELELPCIRGVRDGAA